MSEIEVLSEFKTQLISFFDELISQFPQEGDLVIVRLFLANQVPIKEVMDTFNHKINTNDKQLRKMVRDRNETFFLEHDIFDNLGQDNVSKISHFKRLWRSNLLDEEDKDVIWTWVDAFIAIGDKYTKIISRANA